MKLFKKNISLTAFCLVLSLYTLVAFHAPFYRHLLGVIEPGLNGSFIVASMVLLMVAGNFFASPSPWWATPSCSILSAISTCW